MLLPLSGLAWKKSPIPTPTQKELLSCGCLQQVLGKALEFLLAVTHELTLFCPKTPQQHSSLLTELCTEDSALAQLWKKLGFFISTFSLLERGRTGISGDFLGKPEAECVCSCRSSGITGRTLLHPLSAGIGCHSSQTQICTIKSFM